MSRTETKMETLDSFMETYLIDFRLKGIDHQEPKGDSGKTPRAYIDFKGEEVDPQLSRVGHAAYQTKLRVGFRTGMDAPGNSYDMAETLEDALLSIGLEPYIVRDIRIRAPSGKELWYGLDIVVSG